MGNPFEAIIKRQAEPRAPRSVSNRTMATAAVAFRVLDVQRLEGGKQAIVSLFSARQSVHAIGPIAEIAHLKGAVVSVELLHDTQQRAAHIVRCQALDTTSDVPWVEVPDPAWLGAESAWREFVAIVSNLRSSLQQLIHRVLRREADLKGFLSLGASLADHHSGRGGLLLHTVECMQAVREHGAHRQLDLDLAIAGAALHDIGKCREYTGVGPGSRLTESGQLVGHMLAGYRMVSEAIANTQLEEREALALLHCISASEAPEWVGLRSPRMTEAVLVNSCDRLSGRLEPLCPPPGHAGWYSPRTYRKQPFLALR